MAEDIKRVKAQRERELRKGGKFQALEDEVKDMSHESVRLTTVLDLKSSSISEERKKRKEIEKSTKDLEKLLKEKTKIYDELNEAYNATKAEFDALGGEAEKKEELLQTLLTGVASKEGQENGYQNQLQGKGLAGHQALAQLTLFRCQEPSKCGSYRAGAGEIENIPP